MLAIIIPFYKLDFFNQTLFSLSMQSDKRFKVYIGNDASPDDPKPLLEKYKDSFQFEYKAFETNLGGKSLVKQWERCMELIEDEEWIMILGDDDTLSEKCVEEFYKNLPEVNKQQINVIRFATQIINENDEFLRDVFQHPQIESSIDFLFRKLKGGTRSSLSEYIFKTEKVKKYKFKRLPLAWHADDLAILEFSEFGSIFTINNAIVNFRWSGKNITSLTHNMVIKNKATFNFYYYLLNDKKKHFGSGQKKILYSKLEKSFFNDKKNVYFWLYLTKMYLFNFKIKGFLVLIYRALNKGFKPKKSFLL